ncbi:Ribosomal L1 domain-containing protein 1 [Wallemia ichthyophaga EXF-994]|uniref:Ribosomal L1 domain-containing protein 1 n=1 Tax=Wallemia ichthyophaga (strain EXF-994 / CBS 113033) TaxID=1299270 RepID=R9ARF5_WALI9|nr:Ribosomal L1 domain-containing protein 1 [Wallemia ichthyophaga EXF-994]EOR04792.1 Ribosomal L1 domain-containing protein 1 [Wallemia ichthyophaga EXF-994]
MKSHINNKTLNIPIKNTLIDPRSDNICLLVKDPKQDSISTLEKSNINFISEIVSCQELKGKYKSFESQRSLFSQFDLFLADESILHLLPRFIGKHAFSSNKPIGVNLKSNDLKNHIQSVINSTHYTPSKGVCQSIKFSSTNHTIDQQIANLETVLDHFTTKLTNLNEIKSINIKLSSSDALPIYINDSFKPKTPTEQLDKRKKSSTSTKSKSKKQITGDKSTKPSKPVKSN